MTKTHYAQGDDIEESYAERAWCGTFVGESYDFTSQWGAVTCKRCLKVREKIEGAVKVVEDDIVNQMGDMAKFHGYGK